MNDKMQDQDQKLVMSVVLPGRGDERREVVVEFCDFGIEASRRNEILRQCPCQGCDQYHMASLEICPKTGQSIVAEAHKRAEAEEELRNFRQRTVSAIDARRKYLKDHKSGWKNNWRWYVATIGSFGIFPGIIIIFHLFLNDPSLASFIVILFFLGWFGTGMVIVVKHEKSIRKQADLIYRRVLEDKKEKEKD
ncbi:MAG: hypothetical protein Q8P06_02285 [Candidatus Azambacteria bacterium]|nr:hypothetical protein [Candidatus Azambacteria bacterium]